MTSSKYASQPQNKKIFFVPEGQEVKSQKVLKKIESYPATRIGVQARP